MILGCPRAKNFKQPEPDYITCLHCSEEVEIWTDEVQIECPKCKSVVTREGEEISCLDWCKFSKECVGEERYNKYLKNKKERESIDEKKDKK